MNTIQIIYLVLIFITAFIVAMVIFGQFSARPLDARLKILKGDPSHSVDTADEPVWLSRIVKLTGPIAKLSLPKEGWEQSQLRVRFMNAGLRSASAPILFFAAKTLLTVALPALFVLYTVIAGKVVSPNNFMMMLI
ncbi:MAG TPA: type II secretion system protein, partial [Methylotenera mobilis]|nr:type II secretion system protein [Methylotenera mobilis]